MVVPQVLQTSIASKYVCLWLCLADFYVQVSLIIGLRYSAHGNEAPWKFYAAESTNLGDFFRYARLWHGDGTHVSRVRRIHLHYPECRETGRCHQHCGCRAGSSGTTEPLLV